MNANNEPIQTTTEPLDLKSECEQLNLNLPSDITVGSLLSVVQQRLQQHRTKPIVDFPGGEDAWRSTYFGLSGLLRKLERISGGEPGKNSEPPPPQQTPPPDEPGINPEKPGINPEQPGNARTQAGTTGTESGNSASKDPASPQINTTDQALLEAAADLPYRLQGRSRFDKLSAAQQAAIIGMLEVHQPSVVLKLLSAPPPLGMSFKIGKSALYEFRARYKKRELDRRLKETTDRAIELLNKSENPGEAFKHIYERLLHIKALATASDPEATLEQLDQLTATITKLRKQSLAERKQAHSEQIQKLKFAAS